MSDTPTWQELLDLLERWSESGLESASLEIGDVSFRVSRTGQVAAPVASHHPDAPRAAASPPAAPEATPAIQSVPTVLAGSVVEAPMIGVFYRSPAPGKPVFVSPGDTVEATTTIGIIEVMKLMNPVVAGISGVVIDFEVTDGQPIEFGQSLARIDPS